jgi:hypothetical protein
MSFGPNRAKRRVSHDATVTPSRDMLCTIYNYIVIRDIAESISAVLTSNRHKQPHKVSLRGEQQ